MFNGRIVLASLVGLGVCVIILMTGPEPLEASVPASKPQVAVGSLERDVTARSIRALGTLNPRQHLALSTQVAGEVRWVNEKLVAGGMVAQDEVLLRIDDRDYVIALASAQARYEQAQATIDLEEGRAEIARLEWDAWAATQDEEIPVSGLALRDPQRAEAIALRKSIGAELDRAKLDLSRTSIAAPWPATVVAANTVEGQLLSVGEVTATLFPLDFAIVELQVPAEVVRLLDEGIRRIELTPAGSEGLAGSWAV